MVTNVRGAFKNVRGTLDFDTENPRLSAVRAMIDATLIWTGEPQRDAHLRSADFLDVVNHPQITFRGDQVELSGGHDYIVTGELAIRGVTRSVTQGQLPRSMANAVVGTGGRKVGRPRTEVASGFFGDNRDQSS